jgi:hypothetical protein
MCVTVNKYQEIITALEDNTYPSLNNLFSKLKTDVLTHIDDSIIGNIKKEIISLEKFERKLIFPAIISMFNEASSFSPNIAEIVQLTSSKEERIKQEFILLEEFINETNCVVSDNAVEIRNAAKEVFEALKTYYFPLKKQWYDLLKKLSPESVNCKNRAAGKCKCGSVDEIIKAANTIDLG